MPAGGDVPDRDLNPKFAHKLNFVAEVTAWNAARGPSKRSVLLGDLNIAPLEHDVWATASSSTWCRTRLSRSEALTRWQRTGAWHDAVRHFVPSDRKLYLVVLSRARLASVGPRTAARPCLGQPGPRGRAPAP